MSDDTPMKACDYLYEVRAGLNNPEYWTTGVWETQDTTHKPGRDARGRFTRGGETRTVVKRCLMGQFGAVCAGNGHAYEYGRVPEYLSPEWNAVRLMALAIDPDADKRYQEAYDSHTRYNGHFGEDYIRQEAFRQYTSIVMRFNDEAARVATNDVGDIRIDREAGHQKVLQAIEDALRICFEEAK